MATRPRSRSKDADEPDSPPGEGAASGGVLAALESGLQEILPGVEILDRDLVFDEGGRAELAAVDGNGRLVLVLVADEDVDAAALAALDAVSFARRNAGILARHVGERRVRTELEPRTLLISPSGDEGLTRRVAPLVGNGLELFGLRTVKSSTGERSYLVPLAGPAAGYEHAGASSDAVFVDALPAEVRSLGRSVVDRVARLDDELETRANPTAIVWRLHDDVLVRLERVGDRLMGSVAPHHESLTIAGPAEAEELLERALSRLVQTMGTGPDELSPERESSLPDEDFTLLTPEEIEAFRD